MASDRKYWQTKKDSPHWFKRSSHLCKERRPVIWAEIWSFPKFSLHVFRNEMSHVSETTASSLTEGNPVTSLTLVVLLLVPCVVVLLLLNCLLLGYKLLILSKKKIRLRPERTEEMLLRSPQGVRLSDVAFPLRQDGRRAYLSLSEPVLPHPVTSSRASSRERIGLDHRIRLLRPDGATGSGSQRAPSTIRAISPEDCFTPGLNLASSSRTYSFSKTGWRKSAQVLPHDSGTETRVNLVPPNTPMVSYCFVFFPKKYLDKLLNIQWQILPTAQLA